MYCEAYESMASIETTRLLRIALWGRVGFNPTALITALMSGLSLGRRGCVGIDARVSLKTVTPF
jgi:hypothetical protein